MVFELVGRIYFKRKKRFRGIACMALNDVSLRHQREQNRCGLTPRHATSDCTVFADKVSDGEGGGN